MFYLEQNRIIQSFNFEQNMHTLKDILFTFKKT